jgi:hypothetical protein
MIFAKSQTSTIRTSKSKFVRSSIAAWIKKRARPELPTEAFYLSGAGAYVHPGNALIRRIATFLDQFSADRFGYSFPRLHELFSELCSFRHRIALVWRRGGSRPLQMGPLCRIDSQSGAVVENTRTQSRIRDIERLKMEYSWVSCEDGYLFLLGWDAGWGSSGALGSLETNGDAKDSLFLESQTSEGAAILRRA